MIEYPQQLQNGTDNGKTILREPYIYCIWSVLERGFVYLDFIFVRSHSMESVVHKIALLDYRGYIKYAHICLLIEVHLPLTLHLMFP